MPNFTKLAIQQSFLRLLSQRPITKITVKDIVEDCGINRMTFYYLSLIHISEPTRH